MYTFSNLEPVCCSRSSSNYCFLTCIQVSQEAGQVVWYSHLFKNFQVYCDTHGFRSTQGSDPDSSVGKEFTYNAGDLFDSWVEKICWRRDRLPTPVFLGFPCGSDGKESACSAGDLSLIPGLGRSPGEGKGYPLQYSGLENSMDCIVHGVTKSQTQLSDFHFTFT